MRIRMVLISAVVCLGGVSLPARASAPLAKHFPAGSLIYVGWAGRSLTFDGSMFGQLLNDPLMARIFGAIKTAAETDIRRDNQQKLFGHAWEMARIAWQHPLAAALIDLRKGPREPKPTAALLIDLDKDKPAFAKHFDAAAELLKEELPLTDVTVGTVTYKVHKPRRGPELAYGYLGNILFVTVGEGAAKALVEMAPGKGLTASEKFAACLASVGGKDVQLAYYVDVSALMARIEEIAPASAGPAGPDGKPAPSPAEQAKKVAAALGLDKALAVAGTMRVVDRGMYTKARIFTPAPHRGLLLPLAGTPLTDADLAAVPHDADLLAAVNLSPEAAYAELRRVVKAIEPRADEALAKALGGAEDEIGLSLRRDLLASLGDTWVLSSAPSQGGFLTGTLLTAEVKDAVKLAAAIKRIELKLQPPPPAAPAPPIDGRAPRRRRRRPAGPVIEILKSARVEIHYLALPSRRMPLPVAPAWAVHKGKLYLAPYPQVIQAAVAASGTRKPITQDVAFRKVRGKIAGKCSILGYCNPPKIARQVYNWALIGWTLGANAISGETDVPVRPDWLPSISSIEKYLWPQVCAVSADGEGISFEGYGSLPSPVLAAGLLLNQVPVWLAMPTVRSAQSQARFASEMAELRQVSMALTLYQADQGKMPASLTDPKLKRYFGKGAIARNIAAGKYSYLPPEGNKLEGLPARRTIVVYVPTGTGQRVVIAAFADGHVERISPGYFDRMIKRQLDGAAAVKRTDRFPR
ncbi:MAG TPA: hypothetical protein VM031_05320 [Phycisphaerae bacterium]|nr:hypothetical protein [Phycisphaerae bacterium]